MYENSKELIKILKAFLFEEKYIQSSNTQIDDIVKIAELHNVTAMVGYVLEKNNVSVSDYIAPKLFKKKLQCGILGAKREMLFNEISDALSEKSIEHIIVKGYVLRELYPVKDLRTMSDMDFVIKSEDSNNMEKVMESLNYDLDEYVQGDWSYFKNNMHIEFHEKLTESELGNGFDYDEYLKDCFLHTEEYRKLTKKLDMEYHLIYMFIHCAKHFYNEGCGFRMIMDFAAYIKAYNNVIDWNYVNGELKKIHLYDFSNSIWYLCQVWFNITPSNKEYTMDSELYNELLGYIVKGGTFGEAQAKDRMMSKAARETFEKAGNSKIKGFYVKLKKYVLLDDKSMRGIVGWYKNMPKFMLPVAWIYKAFNAVKNKGLGTTKDIIGSGANNNTALQEYTMLEKLGLYNKK